MFDGLEVLADPGAGAGRNFAVSGVGVAAGQCGKLAPGMDLDIITVTV
jgi:hypothetical protein